jgi:hypothetical protein
MFFFDTNFPMSHTSSSSQEEMTHGYGENRLCPGYGLFTRLQISEMRSTIQRPLQGQTLFLLEPIPLHGLCSTDLSGKSPRHRGMSPFESTETLSHGLPRKCLTQYSGPFQPGLRLANLCRLCPCSDYPGQKPLCQRSLWRRVESNGLCLGLHHHRSLSVVVSLGNLSQTERCYEIASPPGSSWKHPFRRHHYSWKGSLCHDPRSTPSGSGSHLYPGSKVSRFCSSLYPPPNLGVFGDEKQEQFQF